MERINPEEITTDRGQPNDDVLNSSRPDFNIDIIQKLAEEDDRLDTSGFKSPTGNRSINIESEILKRLKSPSNKPKNVSINKNSIMIENVPYKIGSSFLVLAQALFDYLNIIQRFKSA